MFFQAGDTRGMLPGLPPPLGEPVKWKLLKSNSCHRKPQGSLIPATTPSCQSPNLQEVGNPLLVKTVLVLPPQEDSPTPCTTLADLGCTEKGKYTTAEEGLWKPCHRGTRACLAPYWFWADPEQHRVRQGHFAIVVKLLSLAVSA